MRGLPAVFSTRDAAALGVDRRTLTALCRAGTVTRVARGVYVSAHATVADIPAKARAAHGALGYESAGAWWGVELPRPVDVGHVIVGRNRGRRSDAVDGVRLHRADLNASERVQHLGVPVTSPLRTCMDLSRTRPVEESVPVLDGFLRRRLVTLDELAETAAALRTNGRQAAMAAVELADPNSGSVLESQWRVAMAVDGLEMPVSQVDVYDLEGKWLARVDFAWREKRILVEVDGYEFHSGREAYRRDRRRWNALVRAGWIVIVLTWEDVVLETAASLEVVRDILDHSATCTHCGRPAGLVTLS